MLPRLQRTGQALLSWAPVNVARSHRALRQFPYVLPTLPHRFIRPPGRSRPARHRRLRTQKHPRSLRMRVLRTRQHSGATRDKLSSSSFSAGISTCRTDVGWWLLGFQRAGPFTPLDKSAACFSIVRNEYMSFGQLCQEKILDNFTQE